MTVTKARVPDAMTAAFESAEQFVQRYFDDRKEEPDKGRIIIGGERYILIRASSMSVQFLESITEMYPGLDRLEAVRAAATILYDLAHSVGKADARAFHKQMGVDDPIARLSSGPIHFAHSGWAYVEIDPQSRPSPDENYLLVYDHPNSFEADSWLAMDRCPPIPICSMNAGYSTGWCEESFGVPLTAREIQCRALGDPQCRFIMAHRQRIDACVEQYRAEHPELFEA